MYDQITDFGSYKTEDYMHEWMNDFQTGLLVDLWINSKHRDYLFQINMEHFWKTEKIRSDFYISGLLKIKLRRNNFYSTEDVTKWYKIGCAYGQNYLSQNNSEAHLKID